LTNVGTGHGVTVIACFNEAGVYASPMIIFKRIRKTPLFQDWLPAASANGMSESGRIDEDLFLDWLKYFLKFKN
jgi:hypothetical protein